MPHYAMCIIACVSSIGCTPYYQEAYGRYSVWISNGLATAVK
ncbi:hypothetical protein BN135_103 [Cronobacter muytjensii 530]